MSSLPSTLRIDYRSPTTRAATGTTTDVPMSWPFAATLFLAWTWPCWLTLTRFETFRLGIAFDAAVAGFGAVVAVLGFAWRCTILRNAGGASTLGRRQAHLRIAVVAAASLLFVLLHALALPQRVIFELYRARFDAARDAVAWTVPPNASTAYHAIGPYAVHAARRGVNGELAFHSGDPAGGVTFLWSPADNDDPAPLFYPAGPRGTLGGGWRWIASR